MRKTDIPREFIAPDVNDDKFHFGSGDLVCVHDLGCKKDILPAFEQVFQCQKIIIDFNASFDAFECTKIQINDDESDDRMTNFDVDLNHPGSTGDSYCVSGVPWVRRSEICKLQFG